MIDFTVFFVGLCLGSFVTLASHRLPRQQDVITTRSRCPHCGTPLGVMQLLPVLSWLWQRAKCHQCGSRIHWRYPAIELFSGALLWLLYTHYGLTPMLAVMGGFSFALLTMLISDLETRLIPDSLHIMLLPLGIAYHHLTGSDWPSVAISTAFCGGIGLILHYGYYWLRGFHGLGFGDVKFLFICGLWLSNLELIPFFLFLSGVLGVVTGLIWRCFHEDPRFPFAPALILALCMIVTAKEHILSLLT